MFLEVLKVFLHNELDNWAPMSPPFLKHTENLILKGGRGHWSTNSTIPKVNTFILSVG